eukprot:scaffold116098_cov26-Tisochrysis_lutea.AAC.1
MPVSCTPWSETQARQLRALRSYAPPFDSSRARMSRDPHGSPSQSARERASAHLMGERREGARGAHSAISSPTAASLCARQGVEIAGDSGTGAKRRART